MIYGAVKFIAIHNNSHHINSNKCSKTFNLIFVYKIAAQL